MALNKSYSDFRFNVNEYKTRFDYEPGFVLPLSICIFKQLETTKNVLDALISNC